MGYGAGPGAGEFSRRPVRVVLESENRDRQAVVRTMRWYGVYLTTYSLAKTPLNAAHAPLAMAKVIHCEARAPPVIFVMLGFGAGLP